MKKCTCKLHTYTYVNKIFEYTYMVHCFSFKESGSCNTDPFKTYDIRTEAFCKDVFVT